MSRAVFLLPEDRARNAPQIMRCLVRFALDANRSSREDLDFREAPPPVAAVAVARGWAGGRRRDHVAFVQWIATQLANDHVVIIHYDGDVAWKRRRGCKNAQQFEKNVRRPVGHLHATANLVEMVPYAIIEAWTYRNTVLALSLSDGHALHVKAATDPACLEGRTDLKGASPLADAHNLHLVTEGWPAAEAFADGRSFRAFVEALGVTSVFR